MRSRLAGALAGSLLLSLCATPAALARDRDVTVRVEGLHRTLVDETLASLSHRDLVVDSNPDHSCTGSSALGALNAATGDFAATWFDGLGYSVDAVRGERHTFGSDGRFWSFWVNGRMATVGLCGYEPRRGDDLLLFPDCATQDCASSQPLGIRVRNHVHRGNRFRVRVVTFTPDGKAHRVRGAVVRAGHDRDRTNGRGIATLRVKRPGTYEVRAAKRGAFIRSERETLEVR